MVIDHADELRRVVEADSLVYYLEGNVRAHRGDLFMRSQRAVIRRTAGVADFTRNVHFWDPTTEIYADRVVYTEATDVAVATGRVQVVDRESGSNVVADTVRYDRRVGLVTAWPRPHAEMVPSDTARQAEPFDVWADRMRFVSDTTTSEFVGRGEVLIERTDLTAVGDSLHYAPNEGRIALREEPQVETERVFLTAERIDLRLSDEDEIESLIAVGNARTIRKADSIPAGVPPAFGNVSESSFLEGDSIHVAFAGEEIERLVAAGSAKSLNYSRESAPGAVETWSVNYTLADRLILSFEGDTLEQVVATGGQRGVYRQEEVRVGGPERRPSEPIPLPGLASGAVARGSRPRRRPRR
ncbi:MAG: LptA/OstA family protein [Gemmatimonadota bacterium]|nr:LptA/OstA family protein [Gemmatimonadota bacterium]